MAPRTSPRKRATVKYTEEDDQDVKPKATGTKTAGTKRKQADSAEEDEKPSAKPAPDPKKTKTASKKAAKVEDDAMPLAERTAVSGMKKAMYIGAHMSAAGGVQNAVTNAVHIGANAFALFLKSQRKWDNPPLADDARLQFADRCKSHSYDAAAHSLPHGSYLVNLAARDAAKAAQAYAGFADDLARCDALGIRLYNFHPGNTNGEPRPEAIARIAGQLNRAHAATKSVVTVLENMAGSGNVVGSAWEDLRDIIALVDDKSRVGVCIDTCHAFAAGHDLRTPEAFAATMAQFDDIVGRDYLRAVHLNDSKAPFASHRDLHANIGTGFLGLGAFHSLVNDDRFRGMPLILETPIDSKDAKGKTVENRQVWADEIKLLESLVGMDRDGDEFKRLDQELQARGADERSKTQAQADKKAAKGGKKK